MRFKIRHRIPATAAVASVALLAGAGSASAVSPPSLSVSVQTDQIATEVSSDAVLRTAADTASSQLASTQRKLRRVQRRLYRTQRRIHRLQTSLRSRASYEVRSQLRSLRRRVTSLRRQARRLRGRAVAQAMTIQDQAIAKARSAQNGAWLVVNRTGRVFDQSGGIEVSHEGTGEYYVGFDVNRSPCLGAAASGPAPSSIFGTVRIKPTDAGGFLVYVSGPGGPRNGGFYLAATC